MTWQIACARDDVNAARCAYRIKTALGCAAAKSKEPADGEVCAERGSVLIFRVNNQSVDGSDRRAVESAKVWPGE